MKPSREEIKEWSRNKGIASGTNITTGTIVDCIMEYLSLHPSPVMDREGLAKWLHDTYEELAKKEGWNTQETTRVSFDNLPEANKRVMLGMADFVLSLNTEQTTSIKQPKGMDVVTIYRFQLEDIAEALRVTANTYHMRKRETCLHRMVSKSEVFAKNALDGNKDKVVEYSETIEPIEQPVIDSSNVYGLPMPKEVTDRPKLCDGCNVREPHDHRCHGGNCECDYMTCRLVQHKEFTESFSEPLTERQQKLQSLSDKLKEGEPVKSVTPSNQLTEEEASIRDLITKEYTKGNVIVLGIEGLRTPQW